jgi:small neutral amino acid transporter SnatA (MarC family)
MPLWVIALAILGGLFSFAGALFNWEWFMTNYKAAVFVRLLGRSGARVLYAILGLLLAALGFAGLSGLI